MNSNEVKVSRDVELAEDNKIGRVFETTKARRIIVSRRRQTDELGVERWTEWTPWENIRDTGISDTLLRVAARHSPERSGYAEALLDADWGDTDHLPAIVSGVVYYGEPRATREFAVAEYRETIELL